MHAEAEAVRPPTNQLKRGFLRAELAIGQLAAGIAGALLAVELVVLTAGLTARYVFNRPFLWSDELAVTLLLWLAMFGAVAAMQRGEHLKLTVLTRHAEPERRVLLDLAGTAVVLACLLALFGPAVEYVQDQAALVTPGMGINGAWRPAALLAGSALLIVQCVLHILCFARRPGPTAVALLVVPVILAGLHFASPLLADLGNWNLLLFFVVIAFGCMLAGVPIAFAFAAASFSFLLFTTDTPASVLVDRLDAGIANPLLLAIPMFVFLGLMIEMTGMARAMVDVLVLLLGNLRGGLSYVLLAAMYLVSGISGAKAADMAAVAPALFPEMKRRGSHPGDLLSLLACSSAMSETIPPSLVLITVGTVTGVSIAALFTGGLLPALVVAAALAAVCYWRSRSEPKPVRQRVSVRTVTRVAGLAAPGLVLPFLIRAAVVEGVATSTEVATVGVAYSVVAGLLVYRQFDWGRLVSMLVETAALSGAILLVVGFANGMAWLLAQSDVALSLTAAIAGLPGGRITFMAGSIVLFIIFGSVLEGIPAIVLFAPLMFPLARALQVHEVHYAMVAILSMGLGLFTPPFGIGYYTACAIGRVQPEEGFSRIWPYLSALLAGIVLVAAIPWFSVGLLAR